MARTQLFKIRRLLKTDGGEIFNWLAYRGDQFEWVRDEIDAHPFANYQKAVAVCDSFKQGKLRHPRAIYHTVVPA